MKLNIKKKLVTNSQHLQSSSLNLLSKISVETAEPNLTNAHAYYDQLNILSNSKTAD